MGLALGHQGMVSPTPSTKPQHYRLKEACQYTTCIVWYCSQVEALPVPIVPIAFPVAIFLAWEEEGLQARKQCSNNCWFHEFWEGKHDMEDLYIALWLRKIKEGCLTFEFLNHICMRFCWGPNEYFVSTLTDVVSEQIVYLVPWVRVMVIYCLGFDIGLTRSPCALIQHHSVRSIVVPKNSATNGKLAQLNAETGSLCSSQWRNYVAMKETWETNLLSFEQPESPPWQLDFIILHVCRKEKRAGLWHTKSAILPTWCEVHACWSACSVS